MSDVLYNAVGYSKITQAKKIAEDRVNKLYSSFENLTFEKKVLATQEIDILRELIFEYDKYIIAYQSQLKQSGSTNEYVILEGDTLLSIASKIYGKPDRWTDIYMYNELSDILLAVGDILRIPE